MSYDALSPAPETDNLPPYIDSPSPPIPDEYNSPPPSPPIPNEYNYPPPSRPQPISPSSEPLSTPTNSVSLSNSTSGGLSTLKIAVPVVVLLLVVIVPLIVFLVTRSRRRNAAKDAESQKQQTGAVKLQPQTPPENSPAPLFRASSSSSHIVCDAGASTWLNVSAISDSLQPSQLSRLSSSNIGNTSMSSKNTFTYVELLTATNRFSDDNLLGQGGFGFVYKGFINGKEVAVKKKKSGSGQGDREFQAEVETISRVHHRHLVSLVGYCITEDERLLVYEFVPNQTLDHHLRDIELPTMEWSKRRKIALGSAKGLAYLHEDAHPKTIHRDIKAANILLDHDFEPKVADFGLAKEFPENRTHVSTVVKGTPGYLAPEYATNGILTFKSDVFSFGVVLLELITGRKPIDITTMKHGLAQWAMPLINKSIQEDNYDNIVDPRLQRLGYNKDQMRRMVACAAACIRQSAESRPKMSLVMKVLGNDVSVDELHDGVTKSKNYRLSKKLPYTT